MIKTNKKITIAVVFSILFCYCILSFNTGESIRLSSKNTNKIIIKTDNKSLNTDTKYCNNFNISIKSEKNKYRWLVDPVKIKIKIENIGNKTEIVYFSTGLYDSYSVKNKHGKEIFNFYSFLGGYIPIVYPKEISPGENITWNITWRQIRCFAEYLYLPVFPGNYSIQGRFPIPSCDLWYNYSVNVTIDILNFRR